MVGYSWFASARSFLRAVEPRNREADRLPRPRLVAPLSLPATHTIQGPSMKRRAPTAGTLASA